MIVAAVCRGFPCHVERVMLLDWFTRIDWLKPIDWPHPSP